MINFKVKNDKLFTVEVDGLPTVDYPRDYECDFISKKSIKLYNRHSKKELYNSISIEEITINGVAVTTSQEAVNLLNDVIYNSSSSGGSGGSSFNGQLTQGGTNVSESNPLPVKIVSGNSTPIDYTTILNQIKSGVDDIDGDIDELVIISDLINTLQSLVVDGNFTEYQLEPL